MYVYIGSEQEAEGTELCTILFWRKYLPNIILKKEKYHEEKAYQNDKKKQQIWQKERPPL